MDYGTFKTPLEAVLSGQFELCIPRKRITYATDLPGEDLTRAFIRNASFKYEDGSWTKLISFPVTPDEAKEIKQHQCVTAGMKGFLLHYYTRKWPVNPS